MLTKPCKDCPFRIVGGIRIRPERAREIAQNALHNGSFSCHKTTDGDETEDGDYLYTGNEEECAGSRAFAVRVQGKDHFFARLFPPAVLRLVFPSVAAMVAANPDDRKRKRKGASNATRQ